MPRKKRSQKQAELVKPVPVLVAPRVTTTVLSAICPICGRGIPEKRALKIGYTTYDWIPYFDSITWDKDKPFGISYQAGGRGSFQNWEYIGPEDAPELFQSLKKRFLQALREWQAKGWLDREELRNGLVDGGIDKDGRGDKL